MPKTIDPLQLFTEYFEINIVVLPFRQKRRPALEIRCNAIWNQRPTAFCFQHSRAQAFYHSLINVVVHIVNVAGCEQCLPFLKSKRLSTKFPKFFSSSVRPRKDNDIQVRSQQWDNS